MKPSVIIPTLNEARCIGRTLEALLRAGQGHELEVLVVDGGSRDATGELALRAGARVLQAPQGRARQMKAGATASRGDPLVFLHADTLLPPGAFLAMEAALEDGAVVCGSYPIRFDVEGAAYRLVAAGANWRTRLDDTPYGDQALFVRRWAYERVGGYPDVPLCEELLLARSLRRVGRYVFLPGPPVTTSARRLRRGLVSNTLRNWLVRLGFELGLPPGLLAPLYPPAEVP